MSSKRKSTRRIPRDQAFLDALRDGRKSRAVTIPCGRKVAGRKACRGKVVV